MKTKITKAILKKREKRELKRKEKELWEELRQQTFFIQGSKCYLCNSNFQSLKNMDLHHIVDRRIKELKYNILNLVGLCKRCHRLSPLAVHQTSIYFAEILRQKEPERYYYLLKYINNKT